MITEKRIVEAKVTWFSHMVYVHKGNALNNDIFTMKIHVLK
jgi:hypothetical protein